MHWTFAINRDSYFEIRDKNVIKWNSAKEVKKGEIICVYTGKPYSEIGFIFKAKTDLFEDEQIRRDWNKPAILVNSKITIPNPINIKELRQNPILSQWGAVRRNFMGSHFKMSNEEWNELKKLILEKNPELVEPLNKIEEGSKSSCFNDGHRGRAHITRDICYILSNNENISAEELKNMLIQQVGDNENYWRAYFQNCQKENCVDYNIESARSLNLINCTELCLTEKGKELANKISPDELFTHNYSLETKRFFYKLAQEDDIINTAMNILKEKGRMRFWSPKCDLTNKVIWEYNHDTFVCNETKYLQCKNCNHKVLDHVGKTSLVLETLKNRGKRSGFVFWFTSRVTPMHLTGQDPAYAGEHIYWDEEAAEELFIGEVLDPEIKDITIRTFLETVFEKYLNARLNKEPVKGHELSKLFSNKFPKYLEKISNDPEITKHKHNYRAYSSYQGAGSWFKTPWTILYDKNIEENEDFTNMPYYILYIFSEDLKGVYLSLSLSWGNHGDVPEEIKSKWTDEENRRSLRNRASEIRNRIEKVVEIPDDFKNKLTNSPWEPTTIYGKYYNRQSLPPQEMLQNDLIELLKYHNELIDIEYGETVKTSSDEITEIEPQKIILELFKDFNKDYLSIQEGQGHLRAYSETSKRFRSKLNEVEQKKNHNEDVTDDILYGLVPHKGRDIVGFMSDIKAFFEKSLEINPNKFPEIANALYELIKGLDENYDNSEKQNEIINSFIEGGYNKGFGAGTLSPTLFFINHKYPLINSKTKTTSEFLSKIIKKPVSLDTSLINYIDNKKSLETLIGDLSDYVPDFANFAVFDIFCHWMCDKNLGYYAIDQEKYKEWYKNRFSAPVIDYIDLDNNTLALHPEELDIKLKLNPRTLDQICGTLNAGKHIMLTGAPGTGKTDLAESVCKIASSLNFTDGYILTTATSDWTTFDTIGGYMPDETGKLYFEEGKFLQSIRENKWLIIDEINRADIDKAFGQLFTVLSGQGVELPYKNNGNSIKIKRGDKNKSYYSSEDSTYYVGKNWRILATMNVYDKDYLFEMSYAFMRRFTFIYIDLPDDEDFRELINSWCDGLEPHYVDSICSLLRINEYRQIGPAIFKDISEYIKERKKIGNTDYMLNDAVLSYILPQFEGLEKVKVIGAWKILQELFEENNELKLRLEEIATVKLDESQ